MQIIVVDELPVTNYDYEKTKREVVGHPDQFILCTEEAYQNSNVPLFDFPWATELKIKKQA